MTLFQHYSYYRLSVISQGVLDWSKHYSMTSCQNIFGRWRSSIISFRSWRAKIEEDCYNLRKRQLEPLMTKQFSLCSIWYVQGTCPFVFNCYCECTASSANCCERSHIWQLLKMGDHFQRIFLGYSLHISWTVVHTEWEFVPISFQNTK